MTDPKPPATTLGEHLARRGISRRGLLKFSAAMTSLMALPPALIETFAQNLASAKRPSVIWLPFQECTGCTESLTRSTQPSVEQLIFDMVSLDYQETLMAAAGHQAEQSLADAMKRNHGEYLLVIDGSVATGADGGYSCIGGVSNHEMLKEAAQGAKAIICVGTCSSFGGIPQAFPNPTDAQPVSDIIKDKPIVNVPGCPPIPAVITGVLAYFVAFGRLPELDPLRRPKAFYGETIHDRCYRRPFYDQGKFAKSFDDEGARSAGACTRWAARARPPTTPAPRSSGTAAPAFRSSRATAASAARSLTSGTSPAASTSRWPRSTGVVRPRSVRRRPAAWRWVRPQPTSHGAAEVPGAEGRCARPGGE